MHRHIRTPVVVLLSVFFFCSLTFAAETMPVKDKSQTYSKAEIAQRMEDFFAGTSKGLADIVERIFAEQGRPTGFIQGVEASGALVVGLRYGKGQLQLKGQDPVDVYWQGPTIGFDVGGHAAKVFTLVYNLTDPNQIFQRFPGVDGSAYVVGGLSMNYQFCKNNKIVLVPIRTGVGLRLGVSVGYLHYTRQEHIIPF